MDFNVIFKNIEARKFTNPGGNININNNSTLLDVKASEEILNVGFVFTSNYEPNVGVIRIEGNLEMKDKKETVDHALSEWESSGQKNLPKEIAEKIHNVIISNCMVEAGILARDVRLPVPLPVPNVNFKSEAQDTTAYIR